MVSSLLTGAYTLEEIGEKYGITRERVRQIFKRKTGLPYYHRKLESQKARVEAYKKEMEAIKFYCTICDEPVKRKDSGSLMNHCPECWVKREKIGNLRDIKTTFICDECGDSFHPYRNWRYLKNKPRFCVNTCYEKAGRFKKREDK